MKTKKIKQKIDLMRICFLELDTIHAKEIYGPCSLHRFHCCLTFILHECSVQNVEWRDCVRIEMDRFYPGPALAAAASWWQGGGHWQKWRIIFALYSASIHWCWLALQEFQFTSSFLLGLERFYAQIWSYCVTLDYSKNVLLFWFVIYNRDNIQTSLAGILIFQKPHKAPR